MAFMAEMARRFIIGKLIAMNNVLVFVRSLVKQFTLKIDIRVRVGILCYIGSRKEN